MLHIRHRNTDEVLCRLESGELEGADLRGKGLDHARLSHAYLAHADLRGAGLRGALLSHALLPHSRLDGANLDGATLYCAYLANASLLGASLEHASLEGAVLCRADLRRANLRCASLHLANLTGADLSEADLAGVDLTGAVLDGARGDGAAGWTGGFDAAEADRYTAPTLKPASSLRRASTYRLNKARPGTVQVWTLQELALWERLRRHGVLRCDPDQIQLSFIPAYEWMRQQMAVRLPHYGGGFPWWGWQKPKPDLRSYSRSRFPGDRQVRIQLAVPENEVLPSDYLSWHPVLDRRYLAVSELDAQAWDAGLAEGGVDRFARPLPQPWYSRVVASWERVFDLEALAAHDYWPVDMIQVCFEHMRLEDVVEVTEFVTR